MNQSSTLCFTSQGRRVCAALRPLNQRLRDFDVLTVVVTNEEYQHQIVVARLSSQDGIDQTVSPVRAGALFWGHFVC